LLKTWWKWWKSPSQSRFLTLSTEFSTGGKPGWLYALYKQRCFDKAQKRFALLVYFGRQNCKNAPGGPHADYWPTLAAAGYELKTAAHRMEQVYDKVAGEGAR